MSKRLPIQPGQTIGLKLTPEEREAVLEITGLDTDLETRIRRTSLAQQNVEFTLEELNLLAGCVAGEISHTKDRRLQKKLDRVSERIKGLLDVFEEK
jgi:hypothetical protein